MFEDWTNPVKKERDFLDYVNLGSQLLQNVQLHGIQDQMGTLSKLEAVRLETERLEAVGREWIFQGQDIVEGLTESHLETNPSGSLNIALNLKARTAEYGIKTSSFKSFDDKERLQKFTRSLDRLISQCETKLSESAKQAVSNSVKFQAEEPDLLRLIQLVSLQEELEDKKGQLARIPNETLLSASVARGFIIVGFGLLVLGLMILNRKASLSSGVDVGIIIAAVMIFVFGVLGALTVTHQNALDLKSAIQPMLESEQSRCKEIAILKEPIGKNETSAVYRDMLDKRRRLIQHVLEPIKFPLDSAALENILAASQHQPDQADADQIAGPTLPVRS